MLVHVGRIYGMRNAPPAHEGQQSLRHSGSGILTDFRLCGYFVVYQTDPPECKHHA